MHGGAAGSGAPSGKRHGRYRHGACTHEWLELEQAMRTLQRESDELIETVW